MWLALLLAGCAGPNPARDAIDAQKAADATSAAYTCPMHPEVGSDAPGTCPKCGMPLVTRTP